MSSDAEGPLTYPGRRRAVASKSSPPAYRQPGVGLSIWLVRLIGGGLLVLTALAVRAYPGGSVLAAALLLAYAALLWRWPQSWLFVVPAALPVVDFAPWTGWFYVDELDFVLAVTVIVAAWRLPRDDKAHLAPGVGVLLGLLGMTWFLSLLVGVLPFESFSKTLLGNYYTKYNAIRVGKGFFWCLLLWPLARRSVGANLVNLDRLFFPGALTGLVLVGVIVIWERAAFVGLTNFSAPHRVTALFSSMHVGGGAIDGYLALSVPFCWWLISRFDRPLYSALGLGIFALGAYTIIVTFSRGLYAGFVVSLLILALGQVGTAARERSLTFGRFLLGAVLLFVLAPLFVRIFAYGGYRTLGAALITLGIGFLVGTRPLAGKRAVAAIATGTLLALVSWMLMRWLSKGAYVAFALSAFTAGAAYWLQLLNRSRDTSWLLATGFVWCLVNSSLVGLHWGGPSARDAALAAALAMALAVLTNVVSRQRVWTENMRSGTTAAILALIFLVALPIVGRSYFIGQRVSQGLSDMDRRVQHWREAWSLQRPDIVSQLFGIGMGRFPAAYYAQNPHGTVPGVVYYAQEGGNTFARLVGASHDTATPIYLGQHASIQPNHNYRIKLRARSNAAQPVRLGVRFCSIVVLFSETCVWAPIEVSPGPWLHYTQVLASGDLGKPEFVGHKPIRFVVDNGKPNVTLDIDDVVVSSAVQDDMNTDNLLRNGDFESAPDHWFFSVMDFWPWHVESSWLLALLETGWAGLFALTAVLVFTFMRLLGPSSQAPPHRALWLASLGGFGIVATLNSQFEFPRVTLLFFLVLLLALMRGQPRPLVDDRMRRRQATATKERKATAFDQFEAG